MAIEIIRQRTVHNRTDYRLVWERRDDRGRSFAFPCDSRGTVAEADLAPAGRANLAACRADAGAQFVGPFLREERIRWWEPAIGLCRCGRRVVLDGDSTCERCGREYNSAGQELVPAELWEEPWDDE